MVKHHMINLLEITEIGTFYNKGYTRNDYFF
jgi:hypothetical protein